MSPRKKSYLTVTDQFCGAGGSSIGAVKAGAEVRMALNHWKLAIETHNTNFPDTDHDCTDISACDPRRYPSTDILIASPECTTHSPAGGTRHRMRPQRDLFLPPSDDPATVRSRATMFDVVRFTEYHRYNCIIVENVVEVLRWELFTNWLQAMHILGYEHRIVCVNSMFCHPTPQSRDRVYIVFWRKGNRAPALDVRPRAHCQHCGKDVAARQTWKNGRSVGKYRQQYVYTCPKCRREVQPYYYAALNALDLSLPAQRIGDRVKPLRPRTMDRIRYGLEKYGRRALLVTTNQTTDGGRVRVLTDPHFTQTASWLTGLVWPGFVVETAYSQDPEGRVRPVDRELSTQGCQQSAALIGLPFFTTAGSNVSMGCGDGPMLTQTATERFAAVIPPASLVANRAHNTPRSLAHPISTIATGGHQMLIHPAALMRMQHAGAFRVSPLTEPTSSMVASASVDAVISPSPFLVQHYGTNNASSLEQPVPVVTTVDRHELVFPEEEMQVEDCYFRMLQPHEIGAAMAFPRDYVVLGNKRDKVKQFGNAVTPPVMETLMRRCAATFGSAA